MSSTYINLPIVNANFEEGASVQATPNRFSIADYSQYVGSTGVKLLDQNMGRSFLFIQNTSKSKIWLNFNIDAQPGFPSVQINANQILFMESSSITTDSIYAIGEAENLPIVVKEG